MASQEAVFVAVSKNIRSSGCGGGLERGASTRHVCVVVDVMMGEMGVAEGVVKVIRSDMK